jgi:hypothetical protein
MTVNRHAAAGLKVLYSSAKAQHIAVASGGVGMTLVHRQFLRVAAADGAARNPQLQYNSLQLCQCMICGRKRNCCQMADDIRHSYGTWQRF